MNAQKKGEKKVLESTLITSRCYQLRLDGSAERITDLYRC